MDIKKEAIRDLMREYRDLNDTHPNKVELRNALVEEMCMIYQMEEEPTNHLLEAWIDNEFRTELEEKLKKQFNIEDTLSKEPVEDYKFKLPIFRKK
jgi:hypothetical protein